MAIDNDEVLKIAHLARIQLPVDEAPKIGEDLNRILDLFNQLQEVDTTNVEPLAHPTNDPAEAHWRTDMASDEDHRHQYQLCAPEVEGGLYLVPKVIE